MVLVLAAGVGVASIDAARRFEFTSSVMTRGMGTPDNPTGEENRRATANVSYLFGLLVGTATGVAGVIAARLAWGLWRNPVSGTRTSGSARRT